MTTHTLDFSKFGQMEIEATIRVLQLYLIEKHKKGNKDMWLKKVLFDDHTPDVYMVTDEGKLYHEIYNDLEEVN